MKPEARRIEIPGSHGEGGGALLRTALQMAALTHQSVAIRSIRGATRKPGVNAEDLTVIQAIGEACGANMEDVRLGADRLEFVPKHAPRHLRMSLDIQAHEKGTVPGSALVVAHSLLPVLARAGACSRLTIYGETHGQGVLAADAFEQGTLFVHRRQGIYAFPSLIKAGFGYGARGEFSLEVEPSEIEPLAWPTRGKLLAAGFVLTHHGQREEEIEAQAALCSQILAGKGIEAEPLVVPITGKEPGASLTVWAQFERGAGCGSAHLGRGVSADSLASAACREFFSWYDTEATLDSFLSDQALIPAAFAEGKSVWTTPQVTRRLITMAFVIKQFLPIRLTILGREGEPGTVTIER